jgi:chorismate dehydratase
MQLKPIKISAVSYANTYPFLYGIAQKLNSLHIELSMDVPAVCAEKLIKSEVELGLIPVAKLSEVPNAQIISNYCIGAVGNVKTVLLMSKCPLDEINSVYLDSESRTSVNLVKVLAKKYWKKNWEWQDAPNNFPEPEKHQSIVLIGDKTYNYRKDYPYIYDLSQAWYDFSGKPFVFAVWVANRELPKDFIEDFNQALSFGLQNIDAAIDVYADVDQREELRNYLTNFISYELDNEKKEGMELFLTYMGAL